uniref:GTP:AMP phosphotransferase, mitochondrial n=1 Tax=Strigamia maritima TaxID=126957 RepID=T1J1K4_STRMM
MNNFKVFRLVIIGAPGSGKGTISERIVRDFGFKHVSSGDLLRKQVANKTAQGQEAKCFMDRGQLVPDKLAVKLVTEELRKITPAPWLLDGFPRTYAQAESLQRKEPVDLALNLNVPFDVIIERIRGRWTHLPSGRIYHTVFNPPKQHGVDDVTGEPLEQREDDCIEVVSQRLKTFKSTFSQVIDYYRQLQLLKEFNGRETNEIWPKVHKFLCQFIEPKSGP